MQETLAGFLADAYAVCGALAALLLLVYLLTLALGRRMLNPKRLSDRAYRRLKQRLIRDGILDEHQIYEPRVVGTLVGHIRLIHGWTTAMIGAVGALLTLACMAGAFLVPLPIAEPSASVGFHLALGLFLAIGVLALDILIGNASGFWAATRHVRSIPPDEAHPAPTSLAGDPTSRRRHRIQLLLTGIIILLDVALTLLAGRVVVTVPVAASAVAGFDFAWLTQILFVIVPLMLLSLALGEVLSRRVFQQRPLLVTPDVALARHVDARLREQTGWALRRGAIVSVGFLVFIQGSTLQLVVLSSHHPATARDFAFTSALYFAYFALYCVALMLGAILWPQGTRPTASSAPVAEKIPTPSGRASP